MTSVYEELLAQHGDSPETLGWSAHGQQTRFKTLVDLIPINAHDTVLDVGCGLGHFGSYLYDNHKFRGDYVGVDISERLVNCNRQSESRRVYVLDALNEPLPSADFVVSSGMLNIETGTNQKDMALLLRKCFEASTVGCAVNMLSTQSPRRRADRHYYDPADMLNEAFSLTRHVTLRHDYLDNDFTLYLYKEVRR